MITGTKPVTRRTVTLKDGKLGDAIIVESCVPQIPETYEYYLRFLDVGGARKFRIGSNDNDFFQDPEAEEWSSPDRVEEGLAPLMTEKRRKVIGVWDNLNLRFYGKYLRKAVRDLNDGDSAEVCIDGRVWAYESLR